MYACMIEKISLDVPKGYGDDKDTALLKSGRPSPGRPLLCVSPSNLGICPMK